MPRVMCAVSRYFDRYTLQIGEEPYLVRLCEAHLKEYEQENKELPRKYFLSSGASFKGRKIMVINNVTREIVSEGRNGEVVCFACEEGLELCPKQSS